MKTQGTYYIWVIGCQYNEWDGARIKYALDQVGMTEVGREDADIILILACAVRQTAVNRIYGKIKDWKDKKVIISGCVLDGDKKMFERKGAEVIKWTEAEKLANFLNIKDKDNFIKLLNQGNTNSAFIPIMTGCNNFCAYCAVPYTRGRETSRNFDDVVEEFKKLVEKGRKKIMLLGQNVNSYVISNSEKRIMNGKDPTSQLQEKSDFTILLETLNDIEGDFEISFTSNHPKDMTEDIVEAVSKLPKVKKEIHLPVQAGSDKILKAMNRPYTIEQYMKVVDMIKKIDPEIDILTDVIVGFPGESEEDFQKTVEVFKKVGYKQAFINKYSPRKGTVAFALGDPISWEEKQRRWHILNDIAHSD